MPYISPTMLFSLFARALIALVLGVQVGLILFLTPTQHWLYLEPISIILVALLLSLVFDPDVRQRRMPRQRLSMVLRRALLIIVAPTLVVAVLGALFPQLWPWAMLAVFLETSLFIAFTVGGRINWQAISSAMIGWLGFGIVAEIDGTLVDAAYRNTPGFHFDPFPAAGFATISVLLGFAIAALSGHLGMLLRIWIVDQA